MPTFHKFKFFGFNLYIFQTLKKSQIYSNFWKCMLILLWYKVHTYLSYPPVIVQFCFAVVCFRSMCYFCYWILLVILCFSSMSFKVLVQNFQLIFISWFAKYVFNKNIFILNIHFIPYNSLVVVDTIVPETFFVEIRWVRQPQILCFCFSILYTFYFSSVWSYQGVLGLCSFFPAKRLHLNHSLSGTSTIYQEKQL